MIANAFCHCDFPGLIGALYGLDVFRPFDPTQTPLRYPCWGINDSQFWAYSPDPPYGPVITFLGVSGFNLPDYAIVIAAASSEVLYGSPGGGTFDPPIASTFEGGVTLAKLRTCEVAGGSGNVITGFSSGAVGVLTDIETILDGATAAGICTSALTARTDIYVKDASFFAATDTRLYGIERHEDLDTFDHTIIWSVDYSGGDFTTHFSLDNTSNVTTPSAFNVTPQGDVFGVGTTASSPTTDVYQNGSIIARVTDHVFISYSGGPFARTDGACATIGGQVLLCITDNPLADGMLWIADGDATRAANQIVFAATLDSTDLTVSPVTIGYDPVQQAVVVLWAPTAAPYYTFLTYIREPLAPGNIVGQDGVEIYWAHNNGRSGPSLSKVWGVAVPGSMPKPAEVVGTVITLPPPPTPPVCDPFEDCVGRVVDGAVLDSFFTFFMFVDCTQSGTDGTLGDYTDTVHWLNLYGSFLFSTVLSAASPCSGATSGDTLLYFIATGTQGNYSDPGILWKARAYDDHPERHEETYITGIYVQVECLGGDESLGVHITKVLFETQQWIWIEPNTPTSFFPACVEFDADAASLAVFGGSPHDCQFGADPFSQLIDWMDFDYCGDSIAFRVLSGLVTS